MKIKKIQLSDFRGIKTLSLDLCDPGGDPLDLVVLAGPNGCGKTSILEACLIALGYGALPEGKEKFEYNLHEKETDFRIQLLVQNDAGGDDRVDYSKNTRSHQESNIENNTQLELSKSGIEYFSSWREPKLVGSLPVTAGKPGKRPKPDKENRLWILKQNLINLTAHSAVRQYERQSLFSFIEPTESVFEKINNAWRLFYPRKNQRFTAESVSVDWEKGFDLFLKDEVGDFKISVDKLSSGEIEVLTMLGWLAIRKSPLDILFIDEPELHLHQSWHRVILQALRKVLPNTQIICATHSSEVLDSVNFYQRFTLLEESDPRIRATQGNREQPVVGAE